MNSKHRKTLEAIFTEPTNGNIEWRKIEALFIAVGCKIVEGNGSRMTVVSTNDKKISFHRPHPSKDALKYRVVAARDFLLKIGVQA